MVQEYMFRTYQTLLEEALDDESKAGDIYRYMANISPNVSAAERLRSIAADEDRHHLVVSHLLAELTGKGETGIEYTERMEYALGHRRPSRTDQPKLLFPKTYGDWVELAERMKTESGNDPAYNATINYQLQTISGEGSTETPGAVANAKRWLVQKAGELGIT